MRASTWALASMLLGSGCDGADEAPLQPPSGFTAVAGVGVVALGWDDASARVAIVRFPDPGAGTVPTGAEVALGRTFDAGGVTLFVGAGRSFVDRTVAPCSGYAYHAFTLGSGAARSAPAVVAGVAPTQAPPGTSPAELDAAVVAAGVRLAWDAPSSPSDLVRVERALGRDVAVVHTASGAGTFLDRSPLVAGETYTYVVSSCDACGACAERGAQAVATIPVDVAPTALTVEVAGATVRFSWAMEAGTKATMRLLGRVTGPVEGPDDPDAIVLHEGEGTEAHVAMTTFLPDVFDEETRYHFSVHACAADRCGAGASANRAFTLGEALRGGGHVVYVPHGEAGVCADRTELGPADATDVPGWWASCERQCDVATAEQLSSDGIADADAAGLALRSGEVPFDRVLTSEYCRAVETAEHLAVLDAASIETRADLTPVAYGTEQTRCDATLLLLGGSALGAPDDNALIVGHPGLSRDCALLDGLAPGEAAVVRPTASGPVVLARVAPRAWQEVL